MSDTVTDEDWKTWARVDRLIRGASYVATHTDYLTCFLRDLTWQPGAIHRCGCNPNALCRQHSTIRAAEHYNPELIP